MGRGRDLLFAGEEAGERENRESDLKPAGVAASK